jgi:hypothetical protein
MKLGIMQGRLSLPVDNAMQEFPTDWKNEFVLLKRTGLCHIDWIVTKKSFKSNPILKYDLSLLPINSICADNIIDVKFHEEKYLKNNLEPLCRAAIKNKIYSITIPLLEDSSIKNPVIRKNFIKSIVPYAKKYKDLFFSFEFECEPEEILEVVKTAKNFRVTYDTGNITSYTKSKVKHQGFLMKLLPFIDNVHLKDRKMNGESMSPGNGETDFRHICFLLRQFEYNGAFTIQTARERKKNEFKTVIKHTEFFNTFFTRNIPNT